MRSAPQQLQIKTTQGVCVAIKGGTRMPWCVTDPWGTWRYFGDKKEVTAKIKARIKTHTGEIVNDLV